MIKIKYNRNLFLVGLAIIAIFITGAFLLTSEVRNTARQMGNNVAHKASERKYMVLRNEFRNSFQMLGAVGEAVSRAKSKEESVQVLSAARLMLLLTDKKISSGWFAYQSGTDTLFSGTVAGSHDAGKAGSATDKLVYTGLPYLLRTPQSELSKVINQQGTLYWSNAIGATLSDSTAYAFGFLIKLEDLHEYFWDVDKQSQSYAFIINEDGICVSHPDLMYVGKPVKSFQDAPIIRDVLNTNELKEKEVHSEFLQMPVIRYYTPLSFANQKWVICVSVPKVLVDDNLDHITNYTLMLGAFAMLACVAILWFSQHKWRSEFLKRERAELSGRHLAQRFSVVLESVDQVEVFSVDRQGCYRSFNSLHANRMLRNTGYQPQAGIYYPALLPDAIRMARKASLDRAYQKEHFLIEVDEGETCFQEVYNYITGERGQVEEVVCFRIDITESRVAARRAAAAEERNKGLELEKKQLQLLSERQKKENALLQLQQIKNQINPHFLFNSLNSLHALVQHDAALARSFVVKLSKVYRYMLENRTGDLVTVKEELAFVDQYYFLQQIRFGSDRLILEVNVEDDCLHRKIPFIGLQSMIENAIKHNRVTKQTPLHITISSRGGFLLVRNNFQPRQDVVASNGLGLKYLQNIYSYYGGDSCTTACDGVSFTVYLPLL